MTDGRHAADPRHARVVEILRTYRRMSEQVAARLANAILDAVGDREQRAVREALEMVLAAWDVYLETHQIDELAAAIAHAKEVTS